MARKAITKSYTSTVKDAYDGAISDIEMLAEEMRSWADNMSGTNLENSSKYETVEEAANTLEGVAQEDVPPAISEISVTYTTTQFSRRHLSRATRLSHAVAALEGVIAAAQVWIEEREKLTQEPGDEVEGFEEAREEVTAFIDTVQQTIDEVEGVEFPGMYG